MPTRRLLVLAALAATVLVVAVGVGRSSYLVDGREVACPDRVWSSALHSLDEREPGPCAAAAQERLYAVAAGVMGLVLISGLLSRRR